MNAVEIIPASDRSLLVLFGEKLSLDHHARVLALWRSATDSQLPGVTSVSPAYASLLVRFDPLRVTMQRLEERLRELVRVSASASPALPSQQVELPVCYHPQVAPDLLDLAAECGLSPEEVATVHTGKEYLVYFLGFAPGFAYMGDVDSRIARPRHSAPRTRVPQGAVGIAGRQTGIYPRSMPGGWRLIGCCPLPLVTPDADPRHQTLLQTGDIVRFRSILLDEFQELSQP